MELTTTNITQLNKWAQANHDITSIIVKTSKFYRAMQTKTELYVNIVNIKEWLGSPATPNLTTDGLLLLAHIAVNSPLLTNLIISGHDIGSNAEAFGRILANSKSLTTLVMAYNNIDDITAFGNTLATFPSLTSLKIFENNIESNAAAFGSALALSPSLATLDIRSNNISANDLYDLAKELTNAKALIEVIGCEKLFNKARSQKDALKTKIHEGLDPFLPDIINNLIVDYAGYYEEELDLIGVITNNDNCCTIS